MMMSATGQKKKTSEQKAAAATKNKQTKSSYKLISLTMSSFGTLVAGISCMYGTKRLNNIIVMRLDVSPFQLSLVFVNPIHWL